MVLPPPAAPQASRKSILFVDDNEDMRAAIYIAFSPKYDVTLAVDGIDGYAKANENRPLDLIITDITMPRLDGINMARRLRDNHALRPVPIIFLSGESSSAKVPLGLPGEFDFPHVSKSADPSILQRKVEKALSGA